MKELMQQKRNYTTAMIVMAMMSIVLIPLLFDIHFVLGFIYAWAIMMIMWRTKLELDCVEYEIEEIGENHQKCLDKVSKIRYQLKGEDNIIARGTTPDNIRVLYDIHINKRRGE